MGALPPETECCENGTATTKEQVREYLRRHIKDYHDRKDPATISDVTALISGHKRVYHCKGDEGQEGKPVKFQDCIKCEAYRDYFAKQLADPESRKLYESMRMTHNEISRLLDDMGSRFKGKPDEAAKVNPTKGKGCGNCTHWQHKRKHYIETLQYLEKGSKPTGFWLETLKELITECDKEILKEQTK